MTACTAGLVIVDRHRLVASIAQAAMLRLSLAAAFAFAAGCSKHPELVTTPNLYVGSGENPFALVPAPLQGSAVQVIYATDRGRVDGEPLAYGTERSHSLAFGVCTVDMGTGASWDDLIAASRAARRDRAVPLTLSAVNELGRFPGVTPLTYTDGTWVDDPADVEAAGLAAAQFHRVLDERLALTPRKEVFVFVHGYNNTFQSAAFRIAQVWHFMGREGVPILYSWPAGSGGLLRGYTHDRESSEFTIPHLKNLLRILAAHAGIERVHLLSHSRGTDVLMSALRELHIEHRAKGQRTRDAMRIGQVVFAAPDIDLQVFIQRNMAERTAFVAERMTIYVSPSDKAIGIADWLFDSVVRLGRVKESDLDPELAAYAENHPTLSIVDVRAKSGFLGHGYFTSNPAVLSDLILVLRDGRAPGAEHGRPLVDRDAGFWELHEGYPIEIIDD